MNTIMFEKKLCVLERFQNIPVQDLGPEHFDSKVLPLSTITCSELVIITDTSQGIFSALKSRHPSILSNRPYSLMYLRHAMNEVPETFYGEVND